MTRLLLPAAALTLAAALAACSSSSGKGGTEKESGSSPKPVVHSITEFAKVIDGSSSKANTALHDRLCDDLVGTPAQVSATYFGGQSARRLSFTVGNDGMECAYTLDPASTQGDEGAAKDLVVSVDKSANQSDAPAAPTDTDATAKAHGVTIRVQRSDKAQLSAQAVAEQLLARVSG